MVVLYLDPFLCLFVLSRNFIRCPLMILHGGSIFLLVTDPCCSDYEDAESELTRETMLYALNHFQDKSLVWLSVEDTGHVRTTWYWFWVVRVTFALHTSLYTCSASTDLSCVECIACLVFPDDFQFISGMLSFGISQSEQLLGFWWDCKELAAILYLPFTWSCKTGCFLCIL